MTAQASNLIILKEEVFSLVGYTNEGLIKPEDFEINPTKASTACWRGYITTYKITEDSKFTLQRLLVNNKDETDFKSINGIHPDIPKLHKITNTRIFNRSYQNINLQVNYSGYILIANDFIRELYVHMGFHPAWKYKNVQELEIKNGTVISINDLSNKMSKYRDIIKERKENNPKPESLKKDDIENWVKKTFDLKYSR